MSVRKTESRLPDGVEPGELGENALSTDGQSAIVSFVSSPVVAGRENTYVVFVTDPGLGSDVTQFEWTFGENGSAVVSQTTEHGEFAYKPMAPGQLEVAVRLLDASNAEKAVLTLEQGIAPLQAEIEAAIDAARDSKGPVIGNPDVAREIVNDHSPYHQEIALQVPEADDAFERFVYGILHEGVLRCGPADRRARLERLAQALNGQGSFTEAAAGGMGICGVRLTLLAMARGLLPWTELPQEGAARIAADDQLRESLAAADEDARIDLFNLVRFPKSNVVQTARLIEGLRDRYFSGASFNEVLTGLSGTRAHWIARHFREGPLTT